MIQDLVNLSLKLLSNHQRCTRVPHLRGILILMKRLQEAQMKRRMNFLSKGFNLRCNHANLLYHLKEIIIFKDQALLYSLPTDLLPDV